MDHELIQIELAKLCAKIDAILPTLATREHLAEMLRERERSIVDDTKRLILEHRSQCRGSSIAPRRNDGDVMSRRTLGAIVGAAVAVAAAVIAALRELL